MPPRNEKIQVEYPEFESIKSDKKLLVIGISGILFVVLLLISTVILNYQNRNKAPSEQREEQILGIYDEVESKDQNDEEKEDEKADTPQALSPTPSLTITPIVTQEQSKITIPASQNKKEYSYDYLGISFSYPENWNVEIVKDNIHGNGYHFNCEEKITLDIYLKEASACKDNEVAPENLMISGPNGEMIVFWNTVRIERSCSKANDLKLIILEKLITFTPNIVENVISPCYSLMITPGENSIWKQYRIDFKTAVENYTVVEQILESIKYN